VLFYQSRGLYHVQRFDKKRYFFVDKEKRCYITSFLITK
jgi:hypothetical protein